MQEPFKTSKTESFKVKMKIYKNVCEGACFPIFETKLWFEMKSTKLYSKLLLVKHSPFENMRSGFLKGVKTHFGKLALKQCIYRHEKNMS